MSVSTGAPPAYSPSADYAAAMQQPQHPLTSDKDYHH